MSAGSTPLCPRSLLIGYDRRMKPLCVFSCEWNCPRVDFVMWLHTAPLPTHTLHMVLPPLSSKRRRKIYKILLLIYFFLERHANILLISHFIQNLCLKSYFLKEKSWKTSMKVFALFSVLLFCAVKPLKKLRGPVTLLHVPAAWVPYKDSFAEAKLLNICNSSLTCPGWTLRRASSEDRLELRFCSRASAALDKCLF